ncbi:MAG: hypothetical protein P4M08_04335 [Oligoflexia bacterium]|nr:hypothetical protein [Oligoflexia bacterium]
MHLRRSSSADLLHLATISTLLTTALLPLTSGAANDCGSRPALQSEVALTSSGTEKIISSELQSELPWIAGSIENAKSKNLNLKTSLGVVSLTNLKITSIQAGAPVTYCKNFNCSVSIPIQKFQIQADASLSSPVQMNIGPAHNVTITFGNVSRNSTPTYFKLSARISNNAGDPFTIESNGTGAFIGKNSIQIHAPTTGPQAAGDGPGAADLINAIGEVAASDDSTNLFNQTISAQLSTAIFPLVSAKVNAALTNLPLFGRPVDIKHAALPNRFSNTPSTLDVDLRVSALEADQATHTIDMLLNTCVACLQSQDAPSGDTNYFSSGNAPAASTYDLGLGVTDQSLNDAFKNVFQLARNRSGTGTMDFCLNKTQKLTSCPAAGQKLPGGEMRLSLKEAPTVGYDQSGGFYVDIPDVTIQGVPLFGGLKGGFRAYVNLQTSTDHSKIVLAKAKLTERNLAATGNGFLMNQILDGVLDLASSALTSSITQKAQMAALYSAPAGFSIDSIAADSEGVRGYLTLNNPAQALQSIEAK